MARRFGGTLAAVAALCAVGPTVSSASAATTVAGYVDLRFGSPLTVTGDSAGNDIAVGVVSGAFVVSDDRPIEINFGNDCVHLAPNEVRCELPLDDTYVEVDGQGGADRVRIGGLPFGGLVHGGAGRDVLIGGEGEDLIVGGEGRDVERGREGPDLLGIVRSSGNGGDPGRDSYSGGPGDDTLRANDGLHDKRLGCGKGDDVAFKDRGLDPHPLFCEEINRKGTVAPTAR